MEFDGDQIAQMIYLGMIATVLISHMLISRAQGIGSFLRNAVLWGLIFVGVAAGYGLWQDIARDRSIAVTGDGAILLRVQRDGHFHIELDINGVPVPFVIDTGATDLVLSRKDAERVGLNPDSLPFLGRARTANGTVGLARVVLDDVTLAQGDLVIRDTNVPAFVNEGQLDLSLLGMGYLRRYARISIEGDRLTLER